MADDVGNHDERPGHVPGRSNSIPTIQPFEPQADIDADLDRMARVTQFERRERWENFRQGLTITFFVIGFVSILLGLSFSIYILANLPESDREELAKWIIETLCGGLVAGLIGFWALKSFEKL